MQLLKVILRACFAATVFTACGSTSNIEGAPGEDAGASASDAASQCYPFGVPACARGQTCCYSGATGACKDLSACTSHVQFECQSPDGCNPGQVCCVTFPPAAAISALSQDGGGEGGLGQLLMGVTATSFCADACAAPAAPTCRTSADCVGGGICAPLPEGNLVLAVVGAETIVVCEMPEGGLPPSEAGASESGASDGAGSDAGGD